MTQDKNIKTAVPKLRFPEFRESGEWEETTLGKVSDHITEKAGRTKHTLISINAGVGLVSQIEKFGREIAGASYKNYIVIQKEDFAYNKSSSKHYPEGQISMLDFIEIGAVPNSIFTCFRMKRDVISPYFIKFLFENNVHGSWIRNLMSIGARSHGSLNVDNKHLFSLPILYPSFNEQQKIADCLTSLDDLIAAVAEKVEALKAHKKGLMQQLFPAEGKTIPALRFSEFKDSGEWEEKLLKDICKMQAGKFIHTTEIFGKQDHNLFPCYGGNGLRGFTKSLTHEGRYPLIGRQGALCGNITLVSGKFYATEHAVVVSPYQGINTDWLYYILDHLNLNQYATGQAQPGLSVANLEKLTVSIPSKEAEQQKIADCLSSLDEQISTEIQKLETLKAHKKGLMQQMFPQV